MDGSRPKTEKTYAEYVGSEKHWLEGLVTRPSAHWVANVDCRMTVHHGFPVSVNVTEWENSYVCSPYTAFISYAREELCKLKSPSLEKALGYLISVLGFVLRRADVNKVVHVNNWLMSTNLYPEWDGEDAESLHDDLRRSYPDHVLAFRSLNRKTNAKAMENLRSLGYRLLPSRQVYMFDARDQRLRRPKNYHRDVELLGKSPYRIVPHEEIGEADFPRLVDLYNQLYLIKYSRHNPSFTEALLRLWHEQGLLRMTALRHPEGRIDGIVGIWERAGVTTVPLVGYEMSVPQKAGLYRMLMAIAIEDAHRRRRLLNLSAGASHFKRLRGGEAELEYSAVYYAHLGGVRALVWRLLDLVLRYLAAPLMRYYKV